MTDTTDAAIAAEAMRQRHELLDLLRRIVRETDIPGHSCPSLREAKDLIEMYDSLKAPQETRQ